MAGMKNLSRRDLCVALPAFAVVGTAVAEALEAQTHTSEFPAPQTAPASATAKAVPAVAGGGSLGLARAIPFDTMLVRTNAGGGESRAVAHGTLATGETVNLHESMQAVGQEPPALHVIQHSEFICVRDGQLELQHEVDGKVVAEQVGPGGVFYIAFGTRHAVKNVGTVAAKYFVVAIGGDAK
jgi:hypothetical protein